METNCKTLVGEVTSVSEVYFAVIDELLCEAGHAVSVYDHITVSSHWL